MYRSSISILLLALGTAGCTRPSDTPIAKAPTERTIYSQAAEVALSQQHFHRVAQLYGGPFKADTRIPRHIQKVGEELASKCAHPELPWEFLVLNNSQPFSWSLPGGKVALSRGMLLFLEDEAELAAILAHEIAHVAALHHAPRMEAGLNLVSSNAWLLDAAHTEDVLLGRSAVAEGLIQTPYSWEDEREADRVGLLLMEASGYDPRAAADLQARMVALPRKTRKLWEQTYSHLHPINSQRVQRLEDLTQSARGERREGRLQREMTFLHKHRDAYQRLDDARQLIQEQHPLEALELLEGLHRRIPNEAEVYGLRALAYLALDQDQEADKALSKAMVLNPGYYRYPLERGLNRYHKKLDRRASSDLVRADALLSTASGHYALGLMALGAGEVDQGLHYLRHASAARSSTAKKARRRLALMELPADPARYIEVAPTQQSHGQLVLKVRNMSPVDVRDLVVQVEVPGQLGPQSRNLRLPELLKAGEAGEIHTPFTADLDELSWEIQGVQVVE